MKKQFVITTNEKGFILPHVLFIILLSFICLTTSVFIFKNEMELTQKHIDQLKIETLIQMAYVQFKEEFPTFRSEQEEVHYMYPDGHVKITYTTLNESFVHLYFFVETDSKAIYTVTKWIDF